MQNLLGKGARDSVAMLSNSEYAHAVYTLPCTCKVIAHSIILYLLHIDSMYNNNN